MPNLKFNPGALIFYALGTCIGFLVGGTLYATVMGLAIALGLSFLATLSTIYSATKRH